MRASEGSARMCDYIITCFLTLIRFRLYTFFFFFFSFSSLAASLFFRFLWCSNLYRHHTQLLASDYCFLSLLVRQPLATCLAHRTLPIMNVSSCLAAKSGSHCDHRETGIGFSSPLSFSFHFTCLLFSPSSPPYIIHLDTSLGNKLWGAKCEPSWHSLTCVTFHYMNHHTHDDDDDDDSPSLCSSLSLFPSEQNINWLLTTDLLHTQWEWDEWQKMNSQANNEIKWEYK